MQGTTLTFRHRVRSGTDSLNNPTFITVDVDVDDCLIAPVSEPVSAREQQALHEGRDQLRIHLPKSFTGDVSGSEVVWDGKVFGLDSDSVVHMAANTPTRWNRYFRAEFVANYVAVSTDGFFPVYYGTDVDTVLDSAQVVALQNSQTLSQIAFQFELDGGGDYLYFAYPVAFGAAHVYVNGFTVTAWEITQVTIGPTDYYVYRSHYMQHGDSIQIELT